jgi:hypothetical protein
MSYRLASAIASHPRVRSLSDDARRAYFVMWDRVSDPLGMAEKELCALLAWSTQNRMGGEETLHALRDAGLVVEIDSHWFPISPALFDDLDTWRETDSGTTPTEADTHAAIAIAREVGMLGDLDGTQWTELMDYVARRRMGMVAG